jgi:hypothetical protein
MRLSVLWLFQDQLIQNALRVVEIRPPNRVPRRADVYAVFAPWYPYR